MKPRCNLVCTVWGEEFSDFFCHFTLPSLLVEDNLFWLAENRAVTFRIYTSESDLARMRVHRNFRKLEQLISVEPVLLQTLPRHEGHWIPWHHAALDTDASSSYLLIIPDCVYASAALRRIAEVLEKSDVVYHCLPQVSIECIAPQLVDSMRSAGGDEPYDYVELSSLEIAQLLVRYMHPKYAAAIYRPDYFMTHPEYMVRPTPGQLDIFEFSCHPLGFHGRAGSLSYSFNPCTTAQDAAFLDEILAIGCEYALKYFEQYFRWPSQGAHLSRSINLAGWAYSFRQTGATEYSRTNTRLKLSDHQVVSQERTAVSAPRVRYANFMFDYHAALFALYAGPVAKCAPELREVVALAACLPGFRKAIARLGEPLTIFLPVAQAPVTALERLYRSGSTTDLRRFLADHVVAGRLLLKEGQTFVLASDGSGPSRLRVVDPVLAQRGSSATTGRVASSPIHLTNEILVYMAEMRYADG